MSVSSVTQLTDNIRALDVVIPAAHRARLVAVSAPAEPRTLYELCKSPLRDNVVFGSQAVRGWSER